MPRRDCLPGRQPNLNAEKQKSRKSKTSIADLRETEASTAGLPTSTHRLLLHPGRRHRLRRTRYADARTGVDDGDRVPNPSCGGLVQLQRWLGLISGREIGIGGGVEGEVGVGRYLLRLRRGLRGSAGQRRAIGSRRMHRHHVALGGEVGTELEIIVQVKQSTRLEALAEVGLSSELLF